MTGGVNNNANSFKSIQEFISKFDKSGDGSLDKDELIAAQKFFKDADITKVSINNVDYNLLTDENKNKYDNIIGTKGNDLILSTDADKIKGKGGNDIIFATDADKIKGGGGNDVIYYNGDSSTVKGGFGKDELNVDGDGNKVKGGFGKDNMTIDGDHNKVQGGGGEDEVKVAGNNNTVKGGTGNDKMDIKGNYNTVKSGGDFDKIKVDGDYNDIDGNGGGDTIFINGNNNTVSAGDWGRRALLGRILTTIPKFIGMIGIGIAKLPFVFQSEFSDKGFEKSKKINDALTSANETLWGDFDNNIFINGKDNTVKSYFTGTDEEAAASSTFNKDNLYVVDKENSNTTVKGNFWDWSSSTKSFSYFEAFKEWLAGLKK